MDKVIYERVYVETPVDTDADGLLDLIAVYIRRPAGTLTGEKVPAIYVANPYLMFCNEDWYITYDVDKPLKVYPAQDITEEDITFDFSKEPYAEQVLPRVTAGHAENALIEKEPEFECVSELYDHFLQRGYAAVFCGGLGTRGSQGLTLSGSREEVLAFKAVIDWLCGRCRAFTDLTSNIEVKAAWCTGKVAMSAKSYLGTMCIGVAATGVEGLETIIPEAGISNWYAYFRYNGLCVPAVGWQGDDLDLLSAYCLSRAKDSTDYEQISGLFAEARSKLIAGEDRDSGNYNLFWDERNYLKIADRIKASVFIIHGLNDWNVKMNQCIPLFKALEQNGNDRRILLHQGEHVYVYGLKDAGVLDMLERWLDHYLKGIDNGVEKEPNVYVESDLDQCRWMTSQTWPPEGVREIVTAPAAGLKDEISFTDDLSSTVYDRAADNLKEWLDQLILSDDPAYKNRLRFTFDPFAEPAFGACDERELRLCGTFEVTFEARTDQPAAIITAMLVDIGDEKRIAPGFIDNDDGSCSFALEDEPSHYKVITRGWMNAQNRTCNYRKEEIIPGEYYSYRIEMVPMDYTIPRDHTLALIVCGIDAEATLRPDTVTNISIKSSSLKLRLYVI